MQRFVTNLQTTFELKLNFVCLTTNRMPLHFLNAWRIEFKITVYNNIEQFADES
jgi:hypothetical protein